MQSLEEKQELVLVKLRAAGTSDLQIQRVERSDVERVVEAGRVGRERERRRQQRQHGDD